MTTDNDSDKEDTLLDLLQSHMSTSSTPPASSVTRPVSNNTPPASSAARPVSNNTPPVSTSVKLKYLLRQY
ncbi:hypothetical protein FRC19_002412 [Serendipita sp. 401]|nr:hypothetical protein FRC19_002412 [Serendipita sp. 401]KAG9041308.1 hypothetical protein FS842_002603 [Serendipita sp. 407]